jgi:acetyltransferase
MLASAGPDQFAKSLQIVLADPGVDSVMVIYPTPPMFTSGAVAKAVIPVVHNAHKPVVVAVMGERLIQEAVEHLRAARIPEYRFPERAAAALSALVDRLELLEFAQAEPVLAEDVEPDAVAAILGSVPSSSGYGFLPPETSLEILEAYGIPTMKIYLARDSEEAVAYTRKIGFPVAVKVASPDIPHKSDVGGVILNLEDEDSVRAGFESVIRRSRGIHPEALIEGVHIQRMVPSGQEVIIGAVQDPQFGALVMFGSGGIEVEGLKDVVFALAPLTQLEAEDMLKSTWAGRKLSGFRVLPPADRSAVMDVLFRLAQLAADHPRLAEIEINPLRVLPEGQGAVAVDVRIRMEE